MPDRIAAIRARLDAATPGPWQESGDVWWVKTPDPASDDPSRFIHVAEIHSSKHDGEFIINAPADIAWLLDHVASLTETLDEWMAFCGSKECGLQREAAAE